MRSVSARSATLSVGLLQIGWLLLGYGDNPDCACPENVLQIADAPGVSEAIVRVQQALGATLAVATIVLIARRARSASPSRRLAIAPVLVTGAVAFALLIPWVLNDALGHWLDAPEGEVLAEFRARDALAGRRVGWERDAGVVAGIDDSGHLLVDTDRGERVALGAGEVHLAVS